MKDPYKILIVDDDLSNLKTYEQVFLKEKFQVVACSHPQEAFDAYRAQRFDAVLCDLNMPSMLGDQLMDLCLKVRTGIPFIFLTAFGTVEQAVKILRQGAFHFLTKPVKMRELVTTVSDAITASKSRQNLDANAINSDKNSHKNPFIIGKHPRVVEVIEKAKIASQTQSAILILGENGTGKELLAQLIHQQSPFSKNSFIKVNCGAIPETLMEAELFGVTRGAFTGANQDKLGRIELADKGTLFLDEIGELPVNLQVKLLHVLQEGHFERLGDPNTRKSNFRLISATHQSLSEAVESSRFRRDLFYRINVVTLDLPPLRDRLSDIPELLDYFIQNLSAKMNRAMPRIAPQVMDKLMKHTWPGNIRELKNVVEQGLVFCGDTLEATHIILQKNSQSGIHQERLTFSMGTPLKEIEKRVILDTLRATGYDKELTARLLGTTVRTLYRRFDEWKAEDAAFKAACEQTAT